MHRVSLVSVQSSGVRHMINGQGPDGTCQTGQSCIGTNECLYINISIYCYFLTREQYRYTRTAWSDTQVRVSSPDRCLGTGSLVSLDTVEIVYVCPGQGFEVASRGPDSAGIRDRPLTCGFARSVTMYLDSGNSVADTTPMIHDIVNSVTIDSAHEFTDHGPAPRGTGPRPARSP